MIVAHRLTSSDINRQGLFVLTLRQSIYAERQQQVARKELDRAFRERERESIEVSSVNMMAPVIIL